MALKHNISYVRQRYVLHIQSMNTPENVAEVEKYMTPELYAEVKQLISENDYIADF